MSGSGDPDAVDFAAVPVFSIEIPPGEKTASRTFTLTPQDDGAAENDETVTVSATGKAARGTVDLNLTLAKEPTITITDDD